MPLGVIEAGIGNNRDTYDLFLYELHRHVQKINMGHVRTYTKKKKKTRRALLFGLKL